MRRIVGLTLNLQVSSKFVELYIYDFFYFLFFIHFIMNEHGIKPDEGKVEALR